MHKYIQQVTTLLGKNKKKMPVLIALFIVSSLLDVAGIGLIAPYVSLIISAGDSTPDGLQSAINFFGLSGTSRDEIILAVGLLLVLIFILKAFAAIFINYKILGFCFNQGAYLRSYLMKSYQQMSFEHYLKRNSSEYIRNIDLAAAFSHGILQSILRFMSEGVVTIAVFAFLAYRQPYVVAALMFLLIALFMIYDLFFKEKVKDYGVVSNNMHKNIVKGVYEGIEGMKEIKILGVEKYFYTFVQKSTKSYAKAGLRSSMVAKAPRYLIELFLVLFIVAMVSVFISFDLDRAELLPVLSMFGLASIRLTPSVNQMIASISKIRFGRDTVSLLYNDISTAQVKESDASSSQGTFSEFNNLQIRDISFTYSCQKTNKKILSGISFDIEKGEAIGVVGGSGAGKTTLINIITGLLDPTQGAIQCNGVDIRNDRMGYMSMLAYLPQQVFTIDDTILKNVALGVDMVDIDVKNVESALRKAKLLDFVNHLEGGMETIIGERGVKISGGQRQRLALARAFYHDRSVLIMDESTSALDEEVEREVINEIRQLKREKTIIIIAHRMSTIQYCDKVYRVDKGRVVRER